MNLTLRAFHLKNSPLEDSLICKNNKHGLYTIKLGYTNLEIREDDWVWHDQFWVKYLTPKVAFFSWVIVHNKILIMDNIKKNGFLLPNRCVLYKYQEESINNLLVNYEFTQKVLFSILSLF